MNEIETLTFKLKEAKFKENERKDNIQRAKLEERKATRKAKEAMVLEKKEIKQKAELEAKESQETYDGLIAKFNTESPIYYDNAKLYWLWDWATRSYSMVDDISIMCAFTESTGIKIVKGHEKFEFLESVRQTGRRLNPEPLPPNFIQFKDKVINILTDEEFYATPEYMFTSPIPHKLGDSDTTPTIDKLLSEWVHKEHIPILKEILAYSMYKSYPIAKEFFIIGGGRNGKSQFEGILRKFIGKENIISTTLDKLTTSQFGSSKLYKKCVCVIPEIDGNRITKTSTLKALTGNDTMDAEFKGKDSFDFINYAKIIISTNNLPETVDKTDGFYRRAFIVDFPYQFKDTGVPIIDTIPDEEYENLGRQLITILKNLLKRGTFTGDGSIEIKRTRFEGKSNPINEFINEFYLIDINSKINMNDFKINFDQWRVNRKISPISNKRLFKDVKEAGFEIKRETVRGKNVQSIIGLGFKKINEDEYGLDEYEKNRTTNESEW